MTAAGSPSRARGEVGMPKRVRTTRKTVDMVVSRKAIQPSSPMSRWRTDIGVARIAS